MPNRARSSFALLVCTAAAAILATLALYRGYSAVDACLWLWVIWFQMAHWLGRTHWMLWLKPGAIRQQARSLRLSGLALSLERGAWVWLLTAGGLWLHG